MLKTALAVEGWDWEVGGSCVLRSVIILRAFTWYRVIKKDGLNWTVNGASTHARQLVAVFQVLCSLYGLTCMGYAQNSLEFVSRSPLIHVVGWSFCLYTDSLFAQTGDSSDKMLFLVGGWMLKQRRNACCTTIVDSVIINSWMQKILCCIVAILLLTDTAAQLC